jgi:HAD superfamily hydrolase (TIGR01549 family)
MRFDAVFFDSGGTLYQLEPREGVAPGMLRHEVDALAALRTAKALEGLGHVCDAVKVNEAVNAALKEFRERHARQLVYHHGDVMLEVLRKLGLPVRPEDAMCLADAYAGPRYASWLFPGTAETLRALEDAGVYLGLIANTAVPSWSMDRAFHGVGLLQFFPTRIYSGDERLAKPDTRIFELAAKRAGVTGKRILYVGDSVEFDIVAARKAGWAAAHKRPTGAELCAEADFSFDQTPELLAFVLGKS